MSNNRSKICFQRNNLLAGTRLIAQVGLLHQVLSVTRAASHPIGNGKEQHAILLERFCLVLPSHGLVHRSPFSFLCIISPYQDREQTGRCHICMCSLVSCSSL